MKNLLTISALFTGALFVAGSPALGATVNYTTSGMFSVTGTTALTGTGGETITFDGVPGLSSGGINSTPATDSLGYFMATNLSGGSVTGSGTFTLTVNQTAPSAGVQTDGGTLSGTISDTAGVPGGGITLTFASTSFTIGGVTYSLLNLTNGNSLAIGTGLTNIQTSIASAVPEPLSLGLMGAGLFGLGILRYRRKNA